MSKPRNWKCLDCGRGGEFRGRRYAHDPDCLWEVVWVLIRDIAHERLELEEAVQQARLLVDKLEQRYT